MNDHNLKITSYNCKNIKTSIGEIQELCNKFDVIFLQETWLMETDLPILSQISADFYSKGLSAMDTNNAIITGRPHGGIAILWKKSFGPAAVPVTYDDCRLLGLEIIIKNVKMLLINVYMPCSSTENLDEFMFYLAQLDSIVSSSTTNCTMILGDLNADLSADADGNIRQCFGSKLLSHCATGNLIISDHRLLDNCSTYTYVSSAHNSTSWLDHAICTASMHEMISSMHVDYTFVSSDHLPLCAEVNLDLAQSMLKEETTCCNEHRIAWDNLTSDDLAKYAQLTDDKLSDVKLDHRLLLCDDHSCSDTSHIAAINKMYEDVTAALISAGCDYQQDLPKAKFRQVQGWNECCKELHSRARDAFLNWRENNSPKTGLSFKIMRGTKAQFKLALRKCRRNKDRLSSDLLAKKLLNKNSKSFWQEVKKTSNSNISMQATTVGGATGNSDICNMWKEHFKSLLNSSSDNSKKECVTDRLACISDSSNSEDNLFSASEVLCAIRKLKKGKSAGLDGLTNEHIIYAHPKLSVFLRLVLTA